MRWAQVLVCLALPFVVHATDDSFNSNGVKIRYVTECSGEAVVLIHGWMSDASMWGQDAYGNPKLKPLAGFQVIALDCRGHGKSDKPHDQAQYGAEMAADVVRLMDHLKIQKAHLIGYSMGTFIAGKVAATVPDRVLSVIYGGQAPLLTGESGSREIEVFAKAVEEGKGLGPYITEVTPAGRPKPTPEVANALADYMFKGKDVKALAAAGLSFGGLEVPLADLAKCTAPSLFIYGANDAENTKTRVATLRKSLKRGDLKVIEGANHSTTLITPEFGTTIVEFLKAHRAPSRS